MDRATYQDGLDYFTDQLSSNREYWRRFGIEPDVRGAKVLDFGCGHGALSVTLAQAGAAQVLGIDLAQELIEFAKLNVRDHYPEVSDRVNFAATDAFDLKETFDVIVSKDTFEHVSDPQALLAQLHRLLVPGGRFYLGFSPLYYSPFGDHGRTGLRVPWAHAVLPKAVVLRSAARFAKKPVESLDDIGLNGWKPKQFERAIESSPFRVRSMRFNSGDKKLLPILTKARRFPVLEPFATISIYAVLEA